MSRSAVVTFDSDPTAPGDQHLRVARQEIGRRLADLIGCGFAGRFDREVSYGGRPYFVPGDTLSAEQATLMGIETEDDLFGGVVPAPFVATKTITHPLIDAAAAAPPSWSHQLAPRIAPATLGGYSVFSLNDARRAGRLLLEGGPVRTKPALASAGRDQTVIASAAELDLVLDAMGDAAIGPGLVIEENLNEVETYSVGQVRVAGRIASYVGVQRMTADNAGDPVYGGSDLLVASGDFDALLALDLSARWQAVVSQARLYDQAAFASYPGLFASRRNYDVVAGRDGRGRERTGVLEQSWRMGGASAAELAALDAFRADPSRRAVRASSVEAYGQVDLPVDAIVYFHGIDDRIGPMSRYARILPHE